MNDFLNKNAANILVVDDELDNLRLLTRVLGAKGYIVRPLANSNLVMGSVQAKPPDLILLDIMMPSLDGYEVCAQLKANEASREIPVIFISALDAVLDKVKAFSIGGTDYITKPFQTEELIARIQNQLTIKQQKLQLQKLTEELRRSNAELELFASVAAHDLQSPLQSIIGSAELLKIKYQNNLNDDAINRINRIIDGGFRMKALINDLLTYAKVGRQTEEFVPVNCGDVLAQSLANLSDAISSSGAEIIYLDLPTVMGDRTQLIQLFQNLIGNAIKFRRPEVSPAIKISSKWQDDGKWLMGIHDNGIGIESQDHDRVFETFQRLKNAKNYPGTGMGTSICKKIVESHGGRIWVESQLGIGTTFYFTLTSVK